MGKIVFLYPGQGSQKVGMGKELAQYDMALFKHYFSQCDRVTGESVSRFCLQGPADVLSQTHITQPALFTYSLALTECARCLGLTPDLVAGHSLGEYTAAVAAGTLSFYEGLSLVSMRGRLMKQAQDEQPGAMAAVLGYSRDALDALCQNISRQDLVLVTNWNAPEQLVVSGTVNGVQRLIEVVRGRGRGNALRLPVNGAFHSPLMKTVQDAMRTLTDDLCWRDATVPLVANVSGAVLTQAATIRHELIQQIVCPVQWVFCVERLLAEGGDTFIELGSGKVLTKLVHLIAPQITAVAIDSPTKLEKFVKTQYSADYSETETVA